MVAEYNAIEGYVDYANDGGVRLRGEDGWRNWSKYAAAGERRPFAPGTCVQLGLDKDGYIRTAVVLSETLSETPAPVRPPAPIRGATGQQAIAPARPAPAPPPAARAEPPALAQPPARAYVAPDRDTLIVRQNALTNAVAAFALLPESERAELHSDADVLGEILFFAERFEAHNLRSVE